MKTEPGSSQKKNIMIKKLSNYKNPIGLRDPSPLGSQIVKSVPNYIIYDKQTLYMEVQELKKIINNLAQENTKLKTRLAITQTQKERLNKSKQKQETEEKRLYRPYYASSPSHIKIETMKNQVLRKQLKKVSLQLQIYKKQNIRIKQNMKYSKTNQLQIQLKTIIDQNKYLFSMYEQMRMKVEGVKTVSDQILESKFNKLCKENQLYFAQIENLNVQIMNLHTQLRIERTQKLSKEKSLKNEISEEKRITTIKLKQIIDFRRQNSSMVQSKIRSMKAKQKLQQNSFKSHHVHIQPIRKNHIFNGIPIQKLDSNRGNSQELQQSINQDLLNENQRLRLQLNITQHKLKEAQQKIKVQIINHIQSKHSAVPTFFSQNPDNQDTKKQKEQSNILQKSEKSVQKCIQYSSTKQIKLESLQITNQQRFVTPVKIPPILRKSQSQRGVNDQSSRTFYQTPKIKTQYLKQTVNLDLLSHKTQNKRLLTQIKQFLNYRFSYQKYRFVDLKRDIELSNAKELSFIDVCHMLVNQPFYLNLEYCRTIANFIFESQRPKHQQKVEISNLLIKLRKIIKDFQQMSPEKQFKILQNCIQFVKKNKTLLMLQFKKNKNEEKTINFNKFRDILEKYSLAKQEIQYMITQVSIDATDLHHIPYQLVLQRFQISLSERSSNHKIIFQNGQENLNSSQNSVLKQTSQNRKCLQSLINLVQQTLEVESQPKDKAVQIKSPHG